jgi:protein involved in polysaccharide export with SLBB domain
MRQGKFLQKLPRSIKMLPLKFIFLVISLHFSTELIYSIDNEQHAQELSLLENQKNTIKNQLNTDKTSQSESAAKQPFIQGDKLFVQVWLKDRISQANGYPQEVEVPESGDIFFSYIGSVKVAERTSTEIQQEMQQKFSRILKDVYVVVDRKIDKEKGFAGGSGINTSILYAANINQMGRVPQHFLMLGHINRPGVYPFTPGIKVLQAIALGGDFSRYAHHRIFLVRGTKEKPEVIRIDMDDILLGKDLSQNIELAANDAIYVSPKQMWKISEFISTMLMPIMQFRDTVWLYDRFTGEE